MLDKNIKMFDIYNIIDQHFNDDKKYSINCIFSDDNSSNLIFRIRCNIHKKSDTNDFVSILKIIENTILNLTLKGIKGIKKASMMKQDSIYKYEEGQFVKKPEWIVDTNGSNLLEVLSQDGIDSSKTHSNNII